MQAAELDRLHDFMPVARMTHHFGRRAGHMLTQIKTGGKMPARTRQHGNRDFFRRRLEETIEFLDQAIVQGVALLRPLQGQMRHATVYPNIQKRPRVGSVF